MKPLDKIILGILIVGGLNWLLIGLFEFDFVAAILGGKTAILSKIVYVIVGLCALYSLKFLTFLSNSGRRDV